MTCLRQVEFLLLLLQCVYGELAITMTVVKAVVNTFATMSGDDRTSPWTSVLDDSINSRGSEINYVIKIISPTEKSVES